MPLRVAAQAAASGAAADEVLFWDALHLVVGGSAVRDSNLFKRPDPIAESYRTGYVGLRVNKQYSLQRFLLDVTKSTYNYNHYTYLNYKALDYVAAWQWALSPRVTGVISADRREFQVPFYDFEGSQEQNIRVSRNERFSLDGALAYGFHAVLGASRTTQTSSVNFAAQADYRLDKGELGLKYAGSPGNSLAFLYRRGRGEYFHRDIDPNVVLDNRFVQKEYELQHNWLLSGRSSLTGRLTAVERRHEHFSQLDSSGWGGHVGYAWNPTSKLGVTLSARRDLIPSFDVNVTHRVDKTLSLTPRWQPTTRISANLLLARTRTEFLGEGGAITSGEQRLDHYSVIDFNLAWAPTRILGLTAGWQHLRRTSNQLNSAFDARIARVGASLTF